MNIQSHADVFRGIDPGVIQKQTEQSLELREKIQQLKQEQDQKKLDNSTKIDESAVQNTSLIDNSSGVIYNPKFLLRSVAFKGNTIYSSSELSKYYQNLIGKEVYIDQVLGATMEITKRYSQDGYITSQAYIPQQKVADGIITVEVIESEIGNISINGNKWARSSYLNRTVLSSNNLKAGKVFNVSNLKTSLDELNKEDYIQGKIVIEEGSTPKKTDLTLEVRDRFPIEVTVGLDNDGRTVAGRDRGYMQVKNKTSSDSVMKLMSADCSGNIPAVGSADTNCQSENTEKNPRRLFKFKSQPGGAFKEYDIKGVANTIKVGIYQPIAKGENYKLNSDLTLNFLNARTTAGCSMMQH
jgi:hemolysin activation/secretion protein